MARTASLLIALLASAALLAPSAVAQTTGVRVVFTGGVIVHQEQVPPGRGHVFRVTCPPGWTVANGTPSGFNPQVPLKGSVVSVVSNSWLFRYDNLSGQPATVTVTVLCTKPRPLGLLPGGLRKPLKLKLKLRTVAATVAPNTSRTVQATCPPGTAPVSAGQQQTQAAGPRARSAQGAGNFPGRISRWEISGRTKTSRFDNDGSEPLDYTAQLVCGDVVDRGGKPVRALVRIKRLDVVKQLHAGHNLFRANCPRGYIVWWTGWEFPAGFDAIAGFYGPGPSGGARWEFESGGSAKAELYATCTQGSSRALGEPR